MPSFGYFLHALYSCICRTSLHNRKYEGHNAVFSVQWTWAASACSMETFYVKEQLASPRLVDHVDNILLSHFSFKTGKFIKYASL